MLVDNCHTHPVVNGLTSIKVVFLPPNTTAKLQSMDQGIIKNLKVNYRKILVLRYITAIDKGGEFSVSILDSIHMLSAAWKAVLQSTIAGCFEHAGFSFEHGEMEAEEDEEAEEEEMEVFEDSNVDSAWVRFDCVEEQGVTLDDFVAVDDNVLVAEEMSDSDIVSMVNNKHTEQVEDEEDVAADPPPPPSASDALNTLDMLRRFVESQNHPSSDSLINVCYNMEKFIFSCVQQKTVQSK